MTGQVPARFGQPLASTLAACVYHPSSGAKNEQAPDELCHAFVPNEEHRNSVKLQSKSLALRPASASV